MASFLDVDGGNTVASHLLIIVLLDPAESIPHQEQAQQDKSQQEHVADPSSIDIFEVRIYWNQTHSLSIGLINLSKLNSIYYLVLGYQST